MHEFKCYTPDPRQTVCSWHSWKMRNEAFTRDRAYFKEYKRDKGGEGNEQRCLQGGGAEMGRCFDMSIDSKRYLLASSGSLAVILPLLGKALIEVLYKVFIRDA